jgi:hypothetical protein
MFLLLENSQTKSKFYGCSKCDYVAQRNARGGVDYSTAKVNRNSSHEIDEILNDVKDDFSKARTPRTELPAWESDEERDTRLSLEAWERSNAKGKNR